MIVGGIKMFKKEDRKLLNNIVNLLTKNKELLLKKDNLEDTIKTLQEQVANLTEKKKSLKFVESMYQGKVYIMRTPLTEDGPLLYLKNYTEGRFGGYQWTSDKDSAEHYSFQEAYEIKNDFCAFNDTKENLLIVCVDNIVDESNFVEHKSKLLKKRDVLK